MASLESAIDEQYFGLLRKILKSSPLPSQNERNEALALATDENIELSEAVISLFEAGARITENVFLSAACADDFFLYQLFLDYGWDINSIEFGEPALRLVVDSETRVRWLLDRGADPNMRGKRFGSALATAALLPLFEVAAVFDLLLSRGADLDPEALISSMNLRGQGGIPVVEYLIDHGININSLGLNDETPLHYGFKLGVKVIEKIALLLERGADRTIKNSRGVTPAEAAKVGGHQELVELFSS